MRSITVRRARANNLKNIDVSIPKDKLVVVTGISGSGKSSLVFDILFEEGRRQYLQLIGALPSMVEEDRFDRITGIGPTIAVQQGIIRQSNPRSVVGTKTGILGYLGMLYAHEGDIACSACSTAVGPDLACDACGNVEGRLTTSYFSFNSPSGMCIQCEGRGFQFELNTEVLVPDSSTTLRQMLENAGALSSFQYLLKGRLREYADTPFCEIPDEARNHLLYGLPIRSAYRNRSHNLVEYLRRKLSRREDVGGAMEMMVCPECHGYRVGEEARRVTLNHKHIGELGLMTLSELVVFLEELAKRGSLSALGGNLIQEIVRKADILIQVGLGYLTLYRTLPTLSGGEMQRLFLATHLDSQMESLIYILDEPTVGLHEVEKAALLDQVVSLKRLGNTVIVVEHDRNTIERAEHIIDFGPMAGVDGGEIVYQGDYGGLSRSDGSITGQYLSGKRSVPQKGPQDYVKITDTTPRLTMRHVGTNNLKDITMKLPLGVLVGIAGVSGSGKSSLICDTLVPLLRSHFVDSREGKNNGYEEGDEELVVPSPIASRLEGVEHLAGYAEVSQAPIGRRHNSNPGSYTKIWGRVRRLFAQEPVARQRGYTPGHFSFNSKGACSECRGNGHVRLWLGGSFFVSNRCPVCKGKRYKEELLDVTYWGKTILDVLNMSVSEAARFFADIRPIHSMLSTLERTGMGYITLGQPAPTLSGGEAQRIKLAKEIGRQRKGNILYILDEPTTGLSFHDIAKLLLLLDELVKQGNSAIVIEHDPSVLSYCDWILELGPEGGNEGGKIIAQGSPMGLKHNPRSRTGPFLTVGQT